MPNTKNKYLFLLLAISLLAPYSCSPKAGNKILSFFFDGVPVPLEDQLTLEADSIYPIDSISVDEVSIVAETSYLYHEPYTDRICDVCHNANSLGELAMAEPELCYQCHVDYSLDYKFIHGPVAGGYCSACHNPHMSKSEYLLLKTGQDLCLNCHNSEWIFKNEMHEGIEEYACTECHNPHGGNTWNFY